jgi:hypothetical protein
MAHIKGVSTTPFIPLGSHVHGGKLVREAVKGHVNPGA